MSNSSEPVLSTHSVHRAKTRIQALPKGRSQDEQSMIGVILHIFKKEGILGLYRGFGATMMNTFSMRASYSLPRFTLTNHNP